MLDSTNRFSNRVENYIKYRPGYPPEILAYLKRECELSSESVIADIGAGTGIFTKLLLDEGYCVYAIEPNKPMRDAATEQLSIYENFIPSDGTAEATKMANESIDLIVCAQAFHWFNGIKTQKEFHRILKPGGKAALIWNNRLVEADEFSIAYENLLRQDGVDYDKVNHRNIGNIDFKTFFMDGKYALTCYFNSQVFDEAGLIGRAFSSSYVPAEETPEGENFLKLLKDIFFNYSFDSQVSFHYQTEVYLGKV